MSLFERIIWEGGKQRTHVRLAGDSKTLCSEKIGRPKFTRDFEHGVSPGPTCTGCYEVLAGRAESPIEV